MAASDDVRQLPPDEVDGEEEWLRETDEPLIRGVSALRTDDDEWPWHVAVWAMECVREDPLEREIRHAMMATLWAVPGVEAILEQQREVWYVAGTPSGEDLMGAAVKVVDAFASRIRAHEAGLPKL